MSNAKIEGGELALLLLAAGRSSRMGQPKQQLLIGGKSLLVHAAEIGIKSDVGKIIVVLGAEEKAHREMLKSLSVEVIYNSRWQTGMGSSLKAGLNHVITTIPKTDAVIVMVCDQPLLTSDHINSLIQKYRKTNALLVASAYSGINGVPALFNHKLFDEILNLSDDQGAKKIIQKHSAEVVDFPGGNIDLDTQADYKSFLQNRSKKMS